jgi:hypothetical protein
METAITRGESLIARRLVIMSLIKEYEAKGLGNCQNAVTLKEELALIAFDKYKDKYPSYLFFTDEQFDAIVKRNKLVTSTIEAYTGHIPDECFEAVKNENIAKEDLRENTYSIKIESDESSNGNYSEGTVSESVFMALKKAGKEEIIRWVATQTGESYHQVEWRLCRTIYHSISDGLYDHTKLLVYGGLKSRFDGLHIAAPKREMNIPKKFIEKLSLVSIASTQPKDPIVFRYVKDGVLVITFWK